MEPAGVERETARRGHVPVLLDETLAGLNPQPGDNLIDATVGAGGHAAGILVRTAPDGRLLGLDADRSALALAAVNLRNFSDRVTLVHGNFAGLQSVAAECAFSEVAGVLLDLGVSSMQLDEAGRGFSFQRDAPLDMRLDLDEPATAATLVNSLSVEELSKILREFGEEPRARAVARAIVAARERSPITSTLRLVEIVAPRAARVGHIHPATRSFQALRIATNRELDKLKEALPQAIDLLRPGGRLAVISFHSLEDRIVKQFMAREQRGCVCPSRVPKCVCGRKPTLRTLTKKPTVATEEEVRRNPRSRSAKLRVAEKLEGRT